MIFGNEEIFRDFDIDYEAIRKDLSIEQVKTILTDLGADQFREEENWFITNTICHNPAGAPASMKLYYYYDTCLFHCYTECNDSFNIYELVKRVKIINGEKEYNFYDAANFILRYVGNIKTKDEVIYQSKAQRFHKRIQNTNLSQYNEEILNAFVVGYPKIWLEEGITKEAMNRFNILFSPWRNKIIIPHYDIDGNMIGIRGRALDEDEVQNFGKYRPVAVDGVLYTHPLSLSIYGLWVSKSALKQTQRAIIFEGEKSVLKLWDMYGDYASGVAVCGSNISQIQINMLSRLGVKEAVVAFDKEYEKYNDDDYRKYFYRLYNMCKKFKAYMNCSFIVDMYGDLGHKDSPVDKGKEVYEKLFMNRVEVR